MKLSFWPFKKKEEAKPKRAYAGAQIGRLSADWVTSGASVDAEIRGSLPLLRNRSRQLGRDNDYVRQFFRAVESNVIGKGIDFQSQVKMQRGEKLNEPVNQMIEDAWASWGRKQYCHTGGTLSFADIQRLVLRSTAESGDVFVRMVRQRFGGSKIPFALQVIEADQLDEAHQGTASNGNQIRMGIEVDKWNRPVAYYFRKNHPGDYQFRQDSERMRIPAEEVIHLFKIERPGQTRGVPWLASSILRLHQIEGYQEAAVIQARVAASTMGFITSDAGELEGDDVQDGERVYDFESGVFRYLRPGENVQVPNLDQSSKAEYEVFLRANLRSIAAGVGVSYETVSRDYSQSNYSSSRLSLLEDRDHWRVLQQWVIESFHQRVFEQWLDMAVLSGELKLSDYELNPEKYYKVRWMPRGWGWVDPSKEIDAAVQALEMNLTTQADILSQQGLDLNDVMMQRKREKELESSLGLEKVSPDTAKGPAKSPKDTQNQ